MYTVITQIHWSHPSVKICRNIQTRKDIGAECWHGMWPSVQLPSISGTDSKLRLTMVRPSSQLMPELPISKHICQICSNVFRFLTSSDLDIWPFHLKNSTPLTHALQNVYTNFDFSTFFYFWVLSPYGTDRQTDGWTDRWATCIMLPIGQAHNKANCKFTNKSINMHLFCGNEMSAIK